MKSLLSVLLTLSIINSVYSQKRSIQKNIQSYNKELYSSIKYRLVGPFRGGRAGTISGVINNQNLYYLNEKLDNDHHI